MYDVIILGAGPAGLCGAVYARRAGLETLVLEKNPISGGQVLNTWEVDNYLGMPGTAGFDLGMAFRAHADKTGARFATGEAEGISPEGRGFLVRTKEKEYSCRSVIIATGARHRALGAPGEGTFSGKGVSYCATCDGAFFKGKDVAVVGGGDVAVEDAIFLANLCRKVTLIHRRDTLRAQQTLQQRLFALQNVEVLWSHTVQEICGESVVEKVLLRDLQSGKDRELAVSGLFVAVGMEPNSAPFLGTVKADAGGYLEAGEDCVTSVPGIFAAGDVRAKRLRQIITAAADGANAAASAQEWLASAPAPFA